MNIIINGDQKSCSPQSTLDMIIKQYELPGLCFVVELNGQIQDKESYSEKILNEGDVLELIQFVGGG